MTLMESEAATSAALTTSSFCCPLKPSDIHSPSAGTSPAVVVVRLSVAAVSGYSEWSSMMKNGKYEVSALLIYVNHSLWMSHLGTHLIGALLTHNGEKWIAFLVSICCNPFTSNIWSLPEVSKHCDEFLWYRYQSVVVRISLVIHLSWLCIGRVILLTDAFVVATRYHHNLSLIVIY